MKRGLIVVGCILYLGATPAFARTCTQQEWDEDSRWSNPSCTSIVSKETSRGARTPTKAELGADEWIIRYGQSLKLIRASIKAGDAIEWTEQRGELSKLISEVSSWPSDNIWSPTTAVCRNAAATLLVWMDDVTNGTARGTLSAEAALPRAFTAAESCNAGLKKMR
jgi:hypothetical protein